MPLDTAQSGEYLCQVGETVSCGACCGLYNVADASHAALYRILYQRSERFAEIPSAIDAILEFEHRTTTFENPNRPLVDFHHCPYIGLVGEGYVRVGCLLHPLNPKNKGMDFRGLSYYGGMTCRVYFCPSTRILDAGICSIVKSVLDNWYEYGLVVTESRLLAELFRHIEKRTGRQPDPHAAISTPRMASAFRRLFRLKVDWPFRDKRRPYIGNYFFNDNICPRPPIEYGATGESGSPYDAIFQELESVFSSHEDLAAAERILDHLFEDISEKY